MHRKITLRSMLFSPHHGMLERFTVHADGEIDLYKVCTDINKNILVTLYLSAGTSPQRIQDTKPHSTSLFIIYIVKY